MTTPVLQAAVCALDQTHPQYVTLLFQVPVASAHYALGLSMTANSASLPIVSAAAGTNPNTVVITLGGGPAYMAALTVSYDATVGDWNNSSNAVATFTGVVVTNASQVGTASSAYPLSVVTASQLVGAAGSITGTLGVTLNPVDRRLTTVYQPQMIDFGGTYGVTMANPSGVSVLQNLQALVDGLTVSQPFFVAGHPDWAAAAAADWEVQNSGKIAAALAALRTIDTGVDFGSTSITPV
jgi:hypothetical protein